MKNSMSATTVPGIEVGEHADCLLSCSLKEQTPALAPTRRSERGGRFDGSSLLASAKRNCCLGSRTRAPVPSARVWSNGKHPTPMVSSTPGVVQFGGSLGRGQGGESGTKWREVVVCPMPCSRRWNGWAGRRTPDAPPKCPGLGPGVWGRVSARPQGAYPR